MTTLTAHTGTVDVPGGRIAYDVAGSGPALILLHAGITDRHLFDDVWEPFASRRTVVRYDTRGYGETRTTESIPYSNRADLIAVLDHLGIERGALLGVSRAGAIVIDTAVEFPERVSALIPVAAGLGGLAVESTPQEEAAFEEIERLEEARDWEALTEAELRVWVDGLGGTPDRVPGVRRRVGEMLLRTYRDHADEPDADVITLEPRAVERIADLRVPTLVIAGDLDVPETMLASRHIALAIPGARLVVMSGVAHVPPMERPQAFVELVTAFLDEAGV